MSRITRLNNQLQKIQEELADLEKFRDTKALRRFRRFLQGDLSTVREQIKRLTESKEEKEIQRKKRQELSNKNRSSKNKRVWNYVKSIQKNYQPDLTLKDIRSQLKKHRKGLETDISDVAWRNPSP